jgi:tetratricopeptide (TPR) repeat protein
MTVWDLIKAGQYEEACRVADQEFRENPTAFPLMNKVRALLRLGRHREAAELCDESIRISPFTVSTHFIFRGVSDWFDGREEEAIGAWQAGSGAQYQDAAGGVDCPLLLRFASIKRSDRPLRRSSESSLRNACKRRAMVNWPGPLAHFALGKLGETELLAAITSHPILRERQMCQADFHIGVMRMAQGDQTGYAECLARSCSHAPVSMLENEFFLADAELRAISPPENQPCS